MKKYQIFISSTYTDLKEERQAAVEAILLASHIPAGMELFSAGDESQLQVIKRWIDESDMYMLILGGRYGTVEEKSQLSYTELEYDYAVSKMKPAFAVVLSDESIARKVSQFGDSFVEQKEPAKLVAFRKKVTSKISKFVEDHKDVKVAVLHAIREIEKRYELDGWVRESNTSLDFRRHAATMSYSGEEFRLIDSFPKYGESISITQLRQISLKFSNPVDRKSAVYIGTHQFRRNELQQWTTSGYIQYSEGDTRLTWRPSKHVLDSEQPFGPEDLEYHRFDILIGHGTDDSSVRDVYGNTLPQIILPISIIGDIPPIQKVPHQSFGKEDRSVLPWKKFEGIRFFRYVSGWVVAGILKSKPHVVSINLDGSINHSFGQDGILVLDDDSINYGQKDIDFRVNDIQVSECGYLVVPSFDVGDPQKRPILFNTEGKLIVGQQDPSRDYLGVVIDGRSALLSSQRNGSTLFLLESNGKLQSSFNNVGMVQLPAVPGTWVKVRSSRDKIYVFSAGGDSASVWRFRNDGTPDSKFGNNGHVSVNPFVFFLKITDVAECSDGKLIVGGYGNEANILRLNEDGTLDTTFGENGVVQFRADYRSTCERLFLDGEKIFFAGEESSGNDIHNVFVACLNTNGSSDLTFYDEGYFSFAVKGRTQFRDMLIDKESIMVLCQSNADAPLHTRSALVQIRRLQDSRTI